VPDRPLTPLVLAVDTTGEHGSLALARGAEILGELAVDAPSGFAHVIFGQLRALLQRSGVEFGAIDCFAAASGPGSFTGVRVGLAMVKGLAEAAGRPAVAVSNLQALAAFGTQARRAVLLDARRSQIYGAVYDADLRLVAPETVDTLEGWLASLPEGPLEFIAPQEWPGIRGTCSLSPLAGAIARIAAERWMAGEAQDPAALDANYVRRSDAELFWKE
jgi:tRNA threonylcarbamoyladenosine biosynthesis protein TsaB